LKDLTNHPRMIQTFNYNESETRMATPFLDTHTNVIVSGKKLDNYAVNNVIKYT